MTFITTYTTKKDKIINKEGNGANNCLQLLFHYGIHVESCGKYQPKFCRLHLKNLLQYIHVKQPNILRLLYQNRGSAPCLFTIQLMRIKCKKSISWKSRCLLFQNTCISSGRYVSLFLRMLRFQKQGLRNDSSLVNPYRTNVENRVSSL